VRKPTGLFVFAAAPKGGAVHQEVQLFNNSDAEDRAAVKQRREQALVCPRVAPAARSMCDTFVTSAFDVGVWPNG
jgi:hypothetical protein